MPSDKRNSIMADTVGSLFHLFNIASARHLPFGIPQYIPQYIQCILHVLTNVFHSSLLTAKGVNLAVAHDAMEIVHIFRSGYFDCRGAFQTVLDSQCL